MKTFLLIFIIVIFIWIVGSYLAVRNIEEPSYEVLRKTKDYEIRKYKSYLVASVEVEWDQKEALNQGFRLLAGYIFWGNTTKSSISMTAPVSEKSISEKIAMTVPVSTSQGENNTREVSFSMPSKYSLENLPKPNDARVKIQEIAPELRAVHRYTFWSSQKRSEIKKQDLLKALQRDQIETLWNVSSQFYNPPATIPFMRRNEVSVAIKL